MRIQAHTRGAHGCSTVQASQWYSSPQAQARPTIRVPMHGQFTNRPINRIEVGVCYDGRRRSRQDGRYAEDQTEEQTRLTEADQSTTSTQTTTVLHSNHDSAVRYCSVLYCTKDRRSIDRRLPRWCVADSAGESNSDKQCRELLAPAAPTCGMDVTL